MESINPATGEKIKTYGEFSAPQVEQLLQQAQEAFQIWRRTPLEERAAKMHKAAALLRQHQGQYARLMADEMGKPLVQGIAEVEKCAWTCGFYAQEAGNYLAPEAVKTEAKKSFVTFEPLGLVLAVMPWNFPFWQVFRCAAPTLMAGNALVLKHAGNVFGCALAIEDVFREAGFPPGLMRSLLLGPEKIKPIIEHPLVQAVTLTGSTGAGRAVAAQAGAMIKKTVLELGGSDAYVVLEDADLEKTAESCVTSRLINTGQSCIAAKRFIVVKSVMKEFQDRFVALMQQKTMGPPLKKGSDLGPLARHDLRSLLHSQVQRSIGAGAQLLLGGLVPEGNGAFYPPTVLAGVCRGMAAYQEELFGPVASLIEVEDETQAIATANDSVFGLGAAVFTRDSERGQRIAAQELQAGYCSVNDFVRSDARLPFGGIKQSGYGRELSSFGIREFTNIKAIYVA